MKMSDFFTGAWVNKATRKYLPGGKVLQYLDPAGMTPKVVRKLPGGKYAEDPLRLVDRGLLDTLDEAGAGPRIPRSVIAAGGGGGGRRRSSFGAPGSVSNVGGFR